MTIDRTVLLVSPTASLRRVVASALSRVRYRMLVAKSFEEAKEWCTAAPHLLVTELKLGAYNGLHLAVRAALTQTPAIVIGDKAFEQEIEQVGAVWMSAEAAVTDELPAVASEQDAAIIEVVKIEPMWPGPAHGDGASF